jgi:hypothetical protein
VSESPESSARAGSSPAKELAWDAVDEAQRSWATAMRAHQMAPPDPAFRGRLRSLADAASAIHDAHQRALESGLAWRPLQGSDRARPPYELRPGTGWRGPEELWHRFDAAVEQLNAAGARESLADVVAAYGAVAAAAVALADALEASGE